MGKSLGNVLEPGPLVRAYGSDAVRLFFTKEVLLGQARGRAPPGCGGGCAAAAAARGPLRGPPQSGRWLAWGKWAGMHCTPGLSKASMAGRCAEGMPGA